MGVAPSARALATAALASVQRAHDRIGPAALHPTTVAVQFADAAQRSQEVNLVETGASSSTPITSAALVMLICPAQAKRAVAARTLGP
ncbi:hypothetical protein ACIBO2_43615 [Nonomuraea sp. NPDC050022]|uniref:hypothetical protein n=1 Tax=Nonomuraea sp. NPDC050022 TaxID=3364358 RepID=UPI0037901137